MTGELCSQPPLGVAEIMLPQRSTTSRWQVSPRVTPLWSTVGSPSAASRWLAAAARGSGRAGAAQGGQPGLAAVGRAGPQLEAGRVADQLQPGRGVRRGEQRVQRDRRGVAVPGLPVGEGQLGHLDHPVHSVHSGRDPGRVVERVEHGQLLQQHRPLPPRAGLVHHHVPERVRGRRLVGGGERGHVGAGERRRGGGRRRDAGTGGGRTRRPPRPRSPARQACRAASMPASRSRAAAAAASTSRRYVRASAGLRNSSPGRRRRAAAQVQLGRGGPVLGEQVAHPADGGDRAAAAADARARRSGSRTPARRPAGGCRGRAAGSATPRPSPGTAAASGPAPGTRSKPRSR